jgi:hypothetical protein
MHAPFAPRSRRSRAGAASRWGEIALVDSAQALVTGTHHEGRAFQDDAPVRPRGGHQSAGAAIDLVDVVDDGGAVDQGLVVFEDQGRNPAERIDDAAVAVFRSTLPGAASVSP